MDCLECRGACCEDFHLTIRVPEGPDAQRWLELHAVHIDSRKPGPPQLRFDCRCTALTTDGRCGIYLDRPVQCRLFQPGSPDCLDTVRRRRTRQDYRRIRGEHDPDALD
jgi:Fe-S-cluster containining protein